jgi:hypothetical protein
MTWAEVSERKAQEVVDWKTSNVSPITVEVSRDASRRAAMKASDYFRAYAASFFNEEGS